MEELEVWTMEQFIEYYETVTKQDRTDDQGKRGDLTTFCTTFFIRPKYVIAEVWKTSNRKIQLPVHKRVRIER